MSAFKLMHFVSIVNSLKL